MEKNQKKRNQGENHPFYSRKHTEESKKKLSNTMKSKYENDIFHHSMVKHHSESTKKILSEQHKGENNFMYGKHHSEETKKKMSEAQKGKEKTSEHCLNMSINHADVNGEKNPFYGKHHSDESKRKISEANKGRGKSIICLTTKRIFKTISDGAKYYNIQQNGVTLCCKGKLRTSGIRRWN